ncbi:DNA helicase [Tanacetum coccineum]
MVGVFCCIDQNRLDFIRKKQNDIRSDYLSGLYDALSRGERNGFEVGGRIILPMSFTGGPRYMYAYYLDALAICGKLGNLQFCITFTCNVKWLEIKRYMAAYPELSASDRPYIVCRVFKQKIEAFLNFLKNQRIFGAVTGAELPDPQTDPEGYKVVSEMIIHGPCGATFFAGFLELAKTLFLTCESLFIGLLTLDATFIPVEDKSCLASFVYDS